MCFQPPQAHANHQHILTHARTHAHKTVRNDNSSRFGKFTQLQFLLPRENSQSSVMTLTGSLCDVYLLEKSRVCGSSVGERVYHIFYQILAAPDEQKKMIWEEGLLGKSGGDFRYVGEDGVGDVIEGRTDAEKWSTTYDAMKTLGLTDEEIVSFLRAVCVSMAFGNVDFDAVAVGDTDGSQVSPSCEGDLSLLSDLMGVDMAALTQALTYRTVTARNDSYEVPLTPESAREGRDAFAKELYAKQFLWLVSKINTATSSSHASSSNNNNNNKDMGVIGLLDIFGFESFKINRFEQVCINWCNEKLQQKFTVDVFRSVVAEYESEGIPLASIEFSDNLDVLNLLEGRMGAVSILNEECVRPRGSDESFVSKMYTMNSGSSALISNKRFHKLQFSISHYAGDVVYDADGFVRKNADAIPADLIECVRTSQNAHIQSSFPQASEQPSSKVSPSRRSSSSLVNNTVWTKFRSHLSLLMADLKKTNTRYIRCIKPNGSKLPHVMEEPSTVSQLRCAGVVAAVTISRSAFPNRLLSTVVMSKFSCLFGRGSVPGTSGELLAKLLGDATGFEVGATRIYFRLGVLESLEQMRLVALENFVTKISSVTRMYLARSLYEDKRAIVIVVQSYARRRRDRNRFMLVKRMLLILQCAYRVFKSRKVVKHKRQYKAATAIRASWLRAVAAKKFFVAKYACVGIQTFVRCRLQKSKYVDMLAEAKEAAKMENQLKALKQKLHEEEQRRKDAEERAKMVEQSGGKIERGASSELVEGFVAVSESQNQLMDESGKMLEYLRKEVFKMRSSCSELRTENERLKDNNRRLMDANAAAGASFAALNQHAKQLSRNNVKYQNDLQRSKNNANGLKTKISELKEELKMQKATYIAEVHSRMQYSKILEVLGRTVAEKSDDEDLVDEVKAIVKDCEESYLRGPNGMTIDTSRMKTPGRSRRQPRRSLLGYLGSSPKPTAVEVEENEEEFGMVEEAVQGFAKGFRNLFKTQDD